ncbi:MAG: aminotransferase class V-fold PLP-dependent enzyme, partial [Caldisericia bacterium]|nr:aminotransferase class V-fold PLP-dependent enzyme [Caldisericia bacterium]
MSIYLNNSSSSFPKLPATHRALSTFVKEIGVVPLDYDSNSLTKKANEILLSARNGLASLLSVNSSSIFFAPNLSFVVEKLTDKVLSAGDRIIMSAGDVVSTSNVSDKLQSRGVEIIKIPLDKKFGVKPTQFKKISGAKALLFSHVNSITGATIPIDEIIKLGRKKDNPILILDISDSI